MIKNLTVAQVSIILTIVVSLISALAFYLHRHVPLAWWLPLIFVLFGITFLLIYFILQILVFKRINLVYKIISNSNKVKTGESWLDTNKTIDQVQKEVEEWTENTSLQLQNLKSLEDYRKNFLGNISHELKTPLFSVQGYLHTLLEGGMYDEKVYKRYLKRAAKNVERLESIIEDLETIGRLEGGDSILNLSNFDFKDLCIEVIEDLQLHAEDRNVKIKLKIGESPNIVVSADKQKLRQVLNNLIINAIRYGNENGIVSIAYHDLNKYILVEVTDQGEGIKEEHLKHLFDRFYRIDPSRSRELGGSGLGLSIVKHIIEAHNQKVMVKSTVGVGSTFSFTVAKKK